MFDRAGSTILYMLYSIPSYVMGMILILYVGVKLDLLPFLILPACVAIFIAVLAFNLVGDALRDVIAPRVHGRSAGEAAR